MCKKAFVFIIFNCLVSWASCQELIYWDSTRNIQWSDFKGVPQLNVRWAAVSDVAIEVKSCPKTRLPNFFVVSWFDKKGSWTIDRSSPNLLAHEQLHFDIKELFTRKIRYSIDSLHQLDVLTFSTYTNLINQLINRSDNEEDKYDEETHHGTILIKQKEWSEKIARELEILKKV